MPVQLVRRPVPIPVPGGKIIEEHVGRVASGTTSVSVAHMVAPAGWGEPPQAPRFDEVTVVVRGRMRAETAEGTFDVGAGESLIVPAGVRVTYSNPFPESAEYWAICAPAFSVEDAGR